MADKRKFFVKVEKFSEEDVKRYMWPHLHLPKDNQRICAKFLGLKGVKHGDKIGNGGIFRLIENDLYEEKFYQYALPIAKRLWEEMKQKNEVKDGSK